MNTALILGFIVLAAAAAAAWYFARGSHRGTRKKEMPCPHCNYKVPHDSKVCPSCEKEIRKCKTCGTYIHDADGSCEVCGERHSRGNQLKYVCPKCEAPVPGSSKKCPKCGEEYWSPIVASK